MAESVSAAGAAMGESISIFMLHPETFGGSIAQGYQNPLAGYVAGRAGVLGEATGATVAAVFAIFEPNFLAAMWEEGRAVRGAAGAAEVYWEQVAEFGRRHLAGAEGVARIAQLGEKVIGAASTVGVPMFAGWRAMPLATNTTASGRSGMTSMMSVRRISRFSVLPP